MCFTCEVTEVQVEYMLIENTPPIGPPAPPCKERPWSAEMLCLLGCGLGADFGAARLCKDLTFDYGPDFWIGPFKGCIRH